MQLNRNPWKKIWNNRNIASVHNYKNLLKKLMIANGHVGKNKKININDWKKYSQNIIDVLKLYDKRRAISFYSSILDNICFSDYIDRITFQKQIWVFNEMSSLVKTFYNNNLYHNNFAKNKKIYNPNEVRFTKVLTKYSTEYNNCLFIRKLCQELNMDTKDIFSYFLNLKNIYSIEEIYELFNNENYDINKLDVNRIYRYLDACN